MRYGSGVAILTEATSPGGVTRLAATPGEQRVDGLARRHPINSTLAEAIAEAAVNAAATLERIRSEGIDVVTLEEPLYPHRLAAIALPPHLLFVKGNLDALDPARAVAVVGTRHPTVGGRRLAARIAGAMARVEATVVSGLAVGIDGEAHEAALMAGGSTIAVIGSGHARLFPRGHTRLAERIVRSGGAVVSELAPDVEATPGTFPRRNRVIAGMSDATVVVEAPARSGALITASWALEEGRDAFLVPGGIGEPTSARLPVVPARKPGRGEDRCRRSAAARRPRPDRPRRSGGGCDQRRRRGHARGAGRDRRPHRPRAGRRPNHRRRARRR